MAIADRRLTLEEFLALPEEKPALELLDGVVRQKVAPQWLHSRFQYGFAERINRFAEPRKLASAFPELREASGRDSLVPDLAVYRWERIPRTATGRLVNAAPTPPDIAIEIRSPGQRLGDLIDKCRRYLTHGAQLGFVVDPNGETVTRVAPEGSPTTLRGDDRIDLGPVLPDFELTVRDLFATLHLV
ncbi:MAG: Uma2 family endonuclease [Chloroflexi bacterium]|nr:Uma2 family endonuclease [Chloroflexota bacterium]